MGLISQSTRYMHRMTPDNRRGDKMDAFVETFGEAALARAMHRMLGLNERLPKSQNIEVKEDKASGVIIRYLTKHAHGSTAEISSSTGYNKRFARDVLNRLFGAGLVDFDEVQRKAGGTPMRVWRLK